MVHKLALFKKQNKTKMVFRILKLFHFSEQESGIMVFYLDFYFEHLFQVMTALNKLYKTSLVLMELVSGINK